MSIYALSVCHYGTLFHSLCLQSALNYEIAEYVYILKDNFKMLPTKLDFKERFLIEPGSVLLS